MIQNSKKLYKKCLYNAVYLGLLMVLFFKFFSSNNELIPKEKSCDC